MFTPEKMMRSMLTTTATMAATIISPKLI